MPVDNGEIGNHHGDEWEREGEGEREKERKMKKKQGGGRSKMVITGSVGPSTVIWEDDHVVGMKGTRDEWDINKEKRKDMGVGKKKRRKTKWKMGKEMGKKKKR